MDGVVNVHKIAGPTSHDIIDQVRRIFGQRRVGHAGTLDPMATGVLVVCLGKATRIVEYLTCTEKEYRAVLTLGVATDTQDSTGEVISESDTSNVTLVALKNVTKAFVGEIDQVPPMISAIKHEGKPLYRHAREGKTIERAPRRVTVYSITIDDFNIIPPGILPGGCSRPEANIIVHCSSGTYIRTLCADIGEVLGCGGMMSKLERTRVGQFTLENAVTIDQLQTAQSEDRLADYVCSTSEALGDDMPVIELDAESERRVIHGMPIFVQHTPESDSPVRLVSQSGELLAIGEFDDTNGATAVRPRKVFVDR